ncbi:hypothetical protein IAT38_004883 [Cryptococcus sp. DSM 104549]
MSSIASTSTTSSPLLPLTDLDEPDPDFDIPVFLQSCADLMSRTPITPSPTTFSTHHHIVPAGEHTPPYTSDEESSAPFSGYTKLNNLHLSSAHSALHHIMSTTNQTFSAYQAIDSPPADHDSGSSSYPVNMPTRQSQSPPSHSYSYTAPSPISSSYPQTHSTFIPQGTFAPQQQMAHPYAQENSPPWQTVTDAETATSYDLSAQYESDFGTTTDASAASTSAAASTTSKPSKAKAAAAKPERDTIPRPPNAWIIYRSHVLGALGKGEHVPGLDKAMAEVGYRNPAGKGRAGAPSSSDESMPPPKPRIKRGVAPPTEEFLALGQGKTGKGLPQADISKVISYLWKHETADRRRMYETQAELKKAEHQRLHPGYKFKPMRKSEKLKIREENQRVREEAKKEAAAARVAGKPKRTPRTRRRHSPMSPYSRGAELTPRRDVAEMARSLSQSDNSYLSAASSNGNGNSTSNGSWDDRHGMLAGVSTGAFPMTAGSLPALGPDHGTAGAAILNDFWASRDGQQITPDLLSATAMSQESSADSLNLPPPHVLPESTELANAEFGPSQPSAGYLGEPIAIPAAVDFNLNLDPQLIQLPAGEYVGQGVSGLDFSNVLGIDDVAALGSTQQMQQQQQQAAAQLSEVDSLVAGWFMNGESPVSGGAVGEAQEGAEGASGSGLYAQDKTLQSFAGEAAQQADVPEGLFSYSEFGPGLPVGEAPQPQHPLGLDGQGAYHPRMQFGIDANQSRQAGNWDPCLVLEPSSHEGFNPAAGAVSPTDAGPLVGGGQQPISPTESYFSGGPTPRDATFGNRLASGSTHDSGRSTSSAHPAPRYVSNSAFPPTTLSVDPALPGYGGYNFMDRQGSFSALTAEIVGAGMGMMGQDMYRWDEQDEDFAAAAASMSVSAGVSNAWKRRESEVSVAVTAVTSTSPRDGQSPDEGTLRAQRAARARSVAGSFS